MCLAQGPQRSDAGEAQTRGPSVSSQALYLWAGLPLYTSEPLSTNDEKSWIPTCFSVPKDQLHVLS